MSDDDRAAAWEAVRAALARSRAARHQAVLPPEERLRNATTFHAGHVHTGTRRPVVSVRGLTEAKALHGLAETLGRRADDLARSGVRASTGDPGAKGKSRPGQLGRCMAGSVSDGGAARRMAAGRAADGR